MSESFDVLKTPQKCKQFSHYYFLKTSLQVLVVQEKSGGFRGTGVWKFPTGVVDEVGRACRFVSTNFPKISRNNCSAFAVTPCVITG